MQSDNINWSIAVLLSLLLFGSLFMQRGAHMGSERANIKQLPLITRLTFSQKTETAPDVPPVIKPKVKPQAKPIKKIKPKPVATKKIQPVEKIEKIEPVKQAAAQPQTQGQQVSVSSESILQQKREQYIQKLLSHIESFKFYPLAARRRSIEGNVKITFNLQDSGSYQQLNLDGKRSVLVNATRIALEAAVPLPVPADDVKISRQIEFTMVYSLTQ